MKMKTFRAAVTVSHRMIDSASEKDIEHIVIDKLLDQIKLELVHVMLKKTIEQYSDTYRVDVVVGSPDDYMTDMREGQQFIC